MGKGSETMFPFYTLRSRPGGCQQSADHYDCRCSRTADLFLHSKSGSTLVLGWPASITTGVAGVAEEIAHQRGKLHRQNVLGCFGLAELGKRIQVLQAHRVATYLGRDLLDALESARKAFAPQDLPGERLPPPESPLHAGPGPAGCGPPSRPQPAGCGRASRPQPP
jgi:hypothetical protein